MVMEARGGFHMNHRSYVWLCDSMKRKVNFRLHLHCSEYHRQRIEPVFPKNILLSKQPKGQYQKAKLSWPDTLLTTTKGNVSGTLQASPALVQAFQEKAGWLFKPTSEYTGWIIGRHDSEPCESCYYIGVEVEPYEYDEVCWGCGEEWLRSQMMYVDVPRVISGWYCSSCARWVGKRKDARSLGPLTQERFLKIVEKNMDAWKKKAEEAEKKTYYPEE